MALHTVYPVSSAVSDALGRRIYPLRQGKVLGGLADDRESRGKCIYIFECEASGTKQMLKSGILCQSQDVLPVHEDS